jgi:hypothetical protein
MTISVCPVATVAAPPEHVWVLLLAPETYSEWWDAQTERIEPPGPAAPGQVISATSRALGRRWPVSTAVLAIDQQQRALDLRTALPLGIVVRNHIVVQPVDAVSCRVSFG